MVILIILKFSNEYTNLGVPNGDKCNITWGS